MFKFIKRLFSKESSDKEVGSDKAERRDLKKVDKNLKDLSNVLRK